MQATIRKGGDHNGAACDYPGVQPPCHLLVVAKTGAISAKHPATPESEFRIETLRVPTISA
jgi:hypothetical protein